MNKSLLNNLPTLDEVRRELARRDFYRYFLMINPKLKAGWWQEDAAAHLMQFYFDMVDGKRPKMVIQAPPQHGKSQLIVDFISWLSGKDPDLRTIYTSFSDRLGIRANLKLQRIFSSELYQKIFPATSINSANVVTISGQKLRNREIIEYNDAEGYFRNTTVMGSITGESLDLGVIDDPIKGREQANSKTIRDKTWDWFTDDFFSRFSENAGLLAILTRWHVDDPIGRLIGQSEDVKVVTYKAIADEDEPHRACGEPLFPEHKSLEFLLERKKVMAESRWLSLYQQSPIIEGGGMFKVDKFRIIDAAPAKLTRIVRYWDKAATEDGGCNSAGVKIGRTIDGQYIVLDCVKGQWSSLTRERRIRQTAEMDGKSVKIWIEQEPGSGGKESAESTIRNLSGFTIKSEKVTGDKVLRAEPYAAQVEAGNVMLLRGEWNKDFISEHESAPNGALKDQWDAAAGAFNKVAKAIYSLDNVM